MSTTTRAARTALAARAAARDEIKAKAADMLEAVRASLALTPEGDEYDALYDLAATLATVAPAMDGATALDEDHTLRGHLPENSTSNGYYLEYGLAARAADETN